MDNTGESSLTKIDGRSVLGFSLASPDLVCVCSPDIVNQRNEESPEFSTGERINISLENGIQGPEIGNSFKASPSNTEDLHPDASFELVAPLLSDQEKSSRILTTVIGINAGSTTSFETENGFFFSEDNGFSGGGTVRTAEPITGDDSDKRGLSLYQTARIGDFSYYFKSLEPGNYSVDLHFAEIVYTDGPPGMRVFNIHLQGQKVVSCLDIYAKVGSHAPLVISNLKSHVDGGNGLSIRFEGVIGSPIVCGLFIRKGSSECFGEIELSDTAMKTLEMENALKKELFSTKKLVEELMKENELKNRECQEAWTSLRELQNELMRKSMHVGSLAFAIEGQVKEKSRWFSSLRDLTRKLKLLKMDHAKLSEDASVFKRVLADMDGVRSIVKSTMSQHVQLHEDLKIKFLQEVKERKELYNKVLELKGNIRVFCRCRPLNTEEIDGGVPMAIDFEAAKDGELTVKSNSISRKTFKFDAVFSPEAEQSDVFEETAPLAMSVLDGYNVCIFAYGQTGTGKTFTMEGTDRARGVNYRTLEKLYDIIEERKNTFRYEVSVSVLEVYNEQIRDLLVSDSQQCVNEKRLEIKQVSEGGHHVPGLVEARVSNVEEVWQALRTGSNGRVVGSTNANGHSSRSHCMHCVMVKSENLLNGENTRSKLWLVDLAGSERIAKAEVQGERLKETQNINRSLSALGDVISALATRSPHIPFRNSKLTHLLQDSLGGDSKTLMFVQISPNENDLSETLCSLNFASRVRGIELGCAKKQMDKTELFKSKQIVEKLKQDLKSKDLQVKKLEDANYGFDMKLKEKDAKTRSLQDKIKALESQLLVERKLARQHVDSRIAQETKLSYQEDNHNPESNRAPLMTKTQTSIKSQPIKNSESDELSFFPRITESSSMEDDKENVQLPRPTGRASLCPTPQKTAFSSTQAQRRNSLIPLPSVLKAPFLPSTLVQGDIMEHGGAEMVCLPEQVACDSPKGGRNRNKRHIGTSGLRRSQQKKLCMKSPMQTRARRVGVNVGTEKVRISIGSRGRMMMGQRVLVGGARRGVERENHGKVKGNERDKERGWNSGTVGRNIL